MGIYLSDLPGKSGFSSRFSLDLLRLRLASGNMTTAADYMEMGQLLLQAQLPAEAKAVVDKGYAAGVLGTGAEAARQQRLRDLVNKSAAERRPRSPSARPTPRPARPATTWSPSAPSTRRWASTTKAST